MSDDRAVLSDRNTRTMQMRQHIEAVAQSILTDHRADGLFAAAISARRHVHGYSARNRLLMQWQAPLSRLVASLGAFEKIAAEQGVEPVAVKGRRQRVLIQRGATAVWIWGRSMKQVVLRDAPAEEGRIELAVQYVPVTTWAVENIVLAASGEPLTLPDHVLPIDDRHLHRGLLAFAAHKGIVIDHRGVGLDGARGVSTGGRITLQHGDPEATQLPILAHELAHELLHQVPGQCQRPRHIIEGEAQSAAAVLLRHFGHDEPMSAAYLRGHAVRPADVLASMDRVIRAVGEIIEFVEKQEGDQ